jgi:hypothetical protein
MHLALDIDSHAVRAATLDEDGKPTLIPLGGNTTMLAMPAIVRCTAGTLGGKRRKAWWATAKLP